MQSRRLHRETDGNRCRRRRIPPAGTRHFLRARIDPAKAGKSREIRIGGIQTVTPFHGEDRQVRSIRSEVAGGSRTPKLGAKAFKVRVRRLRDICRLRSANRRLQILTMASVGAAMSGFGRSSRDELPGPR